MRGLNILGKAGQWIPAAVGRGKIRVQIFHFITPFYIMSKMLIPNYIKLKLPKKTALMY